MAMTEHDDELEARVSRLEFGLKLMETRLDSLTKRLLEMQVGLGQIAEILARMLHVEADAEENRGIS